MISLKWSLYLSAAMFNGSSTTCGVYLTFVCSSIFYLIKGPLHKLFLGAPNCSVTPLPETKEVYYVVGSAIKTVAYGNLTVTHSGLLTQSGIENILKTLWN